MKNARPKSAGPKRKSGKAPGSRHQPPQNPRGPQRPQPRNQHGQRNMPADAREVNPLRDGNRWVVGIHSCHETLKVRPRSIKELWLRDDYESSESLRAVADHATRHKISFKTKSAGHLENIGSGNQGVALSTNQNPELNWKIFEDKATVETSPKTENGTENQNGNGNRSGPTDSNKHVVLILDGLEDPHNLGSILRTAWLVNAKAIFIPEDRAVGLTPTVCKIASGGAEHVPVEAHTNLASMMQKLKDAGFWIYGLSEKGERRPWEFKLPNKVAWVVGNEGSGLRVTTERACDELVRIPQVDSGSSYNASIALAMALTETCRQLGQPS